MIRSKNWSCRWRRIAPVKGLGKPRQLVFTPEGKLLVSGFMFLVRIHLQVGPKFLSAPVTISPGLNELTLLTEPALSYILEKSTDLNRWTPVRTNIAAST